MVELAVFLVHLPIYLVFIVLIPGPVLSSTDQSDQEKGKEEKICGDE